MSIAAARRQLMDGLAALERAIDQLAQATRAFFSELALLGCACPWCEGPLAMLGEGRCRCQHCHRRFDPTLKLQQCPACEGKLALRRRRYVCRTCRRDVPSRFLYDGKVFDRAYFRQKMAESRQRRRQENIQRKTKQQVQRSMPVPAAPAELDQHPDLVDALNELVGRLAGPEPAIDEEDKGFDLARYEAVLLAKLEAGTERLETIVREAGSTRREAIRLFIAAIFLWHRGRIRLQQAGDSIEVHPVETQRKRQAVPPPAPPADAGS